MFIPKSYAWETRRYTRSHTHTYWEADGEWNKWIFVLKHIKCVWKYVLFLEILVYHYIQLQFGEVDHCYTNKMKKRLKFSYRVIPYINQIAAHWIYVWENIYVKAYTNLDVLSTIIINDVFIFYVQLPTTNWLIWL